MEKQITTLKCQCEDLDKQLESAIDEKVQVEARISHLEEQECALSETFLRKREALDDDLTKLKESFESQLRSEAELRKKMESNETDLKSNLRREAELRKRMETNESELKKQIKQMIDKTMALQERLRKFESGNKTEPQTENMKSNGQKENNERAGITGKVLYFRHFGFYVLVNILTLSSYVFLCYGIQKP